MLMCLYAILRILISVYLFMLSLFIDFQRKLINPIALRKAKIIYILAFLSAIGLIAAPRNNGYLLYCSECYKYL